jgi:hypothetical protein
MRNSIRIFLAVTASVMTLVLSVHAQDQKSSQVLTPAITSTVGQASAPVITTAPQAVAPTITPSVAPAYVPPSTVPTATTPTATPPQPIFAKLKDGSQIKIDVDGSVYVQNNDGSQEPTPDGLLTLRDGVTLTVRGGKRVDE